MAVQGEIPTLVLGDEELWRLHKILDERVFSDPEARRFGFVKVKLAAGLEGQSTKITEFLKMYPWHDTSDQLKKSTLRKGLSNSSKDTLFLADQSMALPKEAVGFKKCVESDVLPRQNSLHREEPCCTAALEKGGEDGLMEHLSTVLNTVSLSAKHQKCVEPSRFLVPREQESKILAVPLAKRGPAVLISMNAETLYAFGMSTEQELGCRCTSCFSVEDGYPDGQEGQGLFYLANVPVMRDKPLKMTNNFSMSFTTHIGMLSELPQYFLGVSCPAAYLGAPHSLFFFHIEDMSLWSWNFLHDGAPKLWIIIPPAFVREVNDLLAREGFGGMHKTCSLRLLHKCYFILPKLLKENNIPYSIVIQRVGEGIILLPNAVHGGVNLGINLAEACNIGTREWLSYGCVSSVCQCIGEMVHAELSTILRKERITALLEAYKSNNVCLYKKDDEYFQQSILHPAARGVTTSRINATGRTCGSNPSRKRARIEVSEVTCPVPECSYKKDSNMPRAWAKHFKTSHPTHCCTVNVNNFAVKYNIKI